MRTVLVHYHIFKNAGSSLDTILSGGESLSGATFSKAARWMAWDPGKAHAVHTPVELGAVISANRDVIAISSHTIRPPFPAVEGITVYPLFFLRHPILRIPSIYKYERSLVPGRPEYLCTDCGQIAGTGKICAICGRSIPRPNKAQRIAGERSFSEYVRWRLRTDVEAVVRDFQTIYLSGEQLRYDDPRRAVATGRAFERALALLEDAPVFGIVERFDETVALFRRRLGHVFPQVDWHDCRVNTTGPELTALQDIRDELGAELYEQIEVANSLDLALYQRALSLFESR